MSHDAFATRSCFRASLGVCLAAAALLGAACGRDRPAEEPPDEPIPPDVEETTARLGGEAARELAGTLMSRLQEAVAAEGAARAVAFCSTEGLPLTAEVSRATGFEVKRVTMRVRNPENAADSLERVALDQFERSLAAGDSLPVWLVQRTPDGHYRYYQPLRVRALCLQCHGAPSDLAEGVAEVLAERYPEDAATGYGEGDFRGLVRVTVPGRVVEAEREGAERASIR